MPYTVDLLRREGIEPTMILLLDRLQKRATVNYGEIARMLPRRLGLRNTKIFPTHIGAVAGTLMDRILEQFPSAPLINLLVVNQDTGLPSRGCFFYLDGYLNAEPGTAERMPQEKRTALILKLWQEVYAYGQWQQVFKSLFGHLPVSALDAGMEQFREQDGKPGDWGGGSDGGESVHHKRLKQYVLDNPRCLGLSPRQIKARRTEQELLSGDSIDVFFATETVSYVVEVKSLISSDDDLKRGLYQCLKYRVVLAAQQERDPDDGGVIANLVVEREVPADLVNLARRLRVKIHLVRVNP